MSVPEPSAKPLMRFCDPWRFVTVSCICVLQISLMMALLALSILCVAWKPIWTFLGVK